MKIQLHKLTKGAAVAAEMRRRQRRRPRRRSRVLQPQHAAAQPLRRARRRAAEKFKMRNVLGYDICDSCGEPWDKGHDNECEVAWWLQVVADAVAQAVSAVAPAMAAESFRHARSHNIYFRDSVEGLADDHPALAKVETVNHTLCADQLQGNPVITLYDWPPFVAFLAAAMGKVVPSHLMDTKLHDFKNLKTTGVPMPDGDTAFDEETFSEPSLPGVQVIQMSS